MPFPGPKWQFRAAPLARGGNFERPLARGGNFERPPGAKWQFRAVFGLKTAQKRHLELGQGPNSHRIATSGRLPTPSLPRPAPFGGGYPIGRRLPPTSVRTRGILGSRWVAVTQLRGPCRPSDASHAGVLGPVGWWLPNCGALAALLTPHTQGLLGPLGGGSPMAGPLPSI